MVHSFTSAGMIPSQYAHLSTFSGLGTVGPKYIRNVYHRNGYIDIVSEEAEMSMQAAVDEAKALPDYDTKGEVCDIIYYACVHVLVCIM